MSEIVLIITATCKTPGCSQLGIANVFEQESGIDFVVHCGQCQHVIEDITTVPKE
jgi:uncharacterized Zn finger protein